MKKKKLIGLLAILLAVAMPVTTAFIVFAVPTAKTQVAGFSTDVKYTSPDVNELMAIGGEPEDLSVSAGAEYLEKAWYEYVVYSNRAVASYRLSDDYRILFYDPYTYTNSLVMDVNFDATTTDFDTMSSYTISKTNTQSMSVCVSSTDTYSKAEQTSGKDITGSTVKTKGETKTVYNHSIDNTTTGTVKDETKHEYKPAVVGTASIVETIKKESATAIELTLDGGVTETITVGSDTAIGAGVENTWLLDKTTNSTIYSDNYTTSTKYTGDDTVEYNTKATTEGWTELSARITKTLGSSRSTSTSWSEEESTTVTKTYMATHFASDGVTPLPWAIVHYEVVMPMKCCLQVKFSGEWITLSTVYTMLTTLKGTCRAWMDNGQAYYEDWGSGEPVTATDFWGQFMKRENLIKMYTDEMGLYPVGGVD